MSVIEQATTVLEAHGYSVCAEAVAALEKDRDRLLGQRQDQAVVIDAMKSALDGVLPFLTGNYWPGVEADAAVDRAIALARKVGADNTALVMSNSK